MERMRNGITTTNDDDDELGVLGCGGKSLRGALPRTGRAFILVDGSRKEGDGDSHNCGGEKISSEGSVQMGRRGGENA
ncbi:hypothetical protein VNO77_34216 [Canavalia gladiata]|uniref:Uncharacterized protein n=1 Tax=Canavalia gladiata TaxID=3824 RepID=A0AAN9PX20_CANGL